MRTLNPSSTELFRSGILSVVLASYCSASKTLLSLLCFNGGYDRRAAADFFLAQSRRFFRVYK